MDYIVRKTLEIIQRNNPTSMSETMIRVDGFEDVKFYDSLAHAVTSFFKGSDFSIYIKLAMLCTSLGLTTK